MRSSTLPRHPRRLHALRGLGPQDLHALASTALLSKRLQTGPFRVSPPSVRATAWNPPGTSALPSNSPANSGVQVSAARSDLTLPPTTPHGDITNDRRHPPLQHPSDDSPSPAHDTADTPDSFHFFWNSSSVFSQWYLCDIEYESVTYNCAEQMMMAQKAALFGDTAAERYMTIMLRSID